jgi:2,3-bisphosphoglycerate-independent phosphoglycerate mutase
MAEKKVILVILDGWGIGENTPANAVKAAHTPCFDSLIAKYPYSELRTKRLLKPLNMPAIIIRMYT